MTPVWRKSSRSGSGQQGQSDCVELAALNGAVGVRDSKVPEAGHLSLSAGDFAALVARVKRAELDL
ncbi:DUF397 domain-containing protein [Actinomadura sp. LD22]|uniref:DUF397 domain-containing protein n=1 Tax=Actinomadura physcomitrii TaxID=2650748 RepID=A0A6I4MJH1_9ACTN|nr:DUF397 domain-containing protein [Actinomadura physcomitrii]MWA06338.1 DUF397 domain-containing protein [Actinomadura physcomitrii]